VLTDLAGSVLGHRLVVSDRQAVRDRGVAAGAAAVSLNWLQVPAGSATGPVAAS
jgi:hypothetical protein